MSERGGARPFYSDPYITIYHGDCREILPELGIFDLLLTDPPYGLGDKWAGGKREWPLHHGQMQWDDATAGGLHFMIRKARQSVIWGGHLYDLPPRRGWLVWDKVVRNFTSGHAELAWTTFDQPIRAFNFTNGQLATEGKIHPTQKPVDLFGWCMSFADDKTETILDPFMGSGTTLVAGKNRGKKVVGIDISERYCELAVERVMQGVLKLEAQ